MAESRGFRGAWVPFRCSKSNVYSSVLSIVYELMTNYQTGFLLTKELSRVASYLLHSLTYTSMT